MVLLKEDLVGKYYWPDNFKDSILNGLPTRRLFDRWNGFQVLFIINCLATLSEKFSIAEGREVESLIINRLAEHTQSELTVFNWLKLKPLAGY